MRMIIRIFPISIYIIMVLSGCKKENNPDNNNNNDSHFYYLSANIDGDIFYVDSTNYQDYLQVGKYEDGSIWLAVRKNIDLMILVDAGHYQGVGTYILNTFGYPGPSAAIQDGQGFSDSYGTDSTHTGILNITYDDDSVVKGTFEFIGIKNGGEELRHITNGEFNLPVFHI